MEDKEITLLFTARSELAIRALAGKYEKLLHKISFQILQNKEDVEECLNDTYLSVWNTIPPAEPDPLSAFVCKIMRNVSLKRYRFNTAQKRDSTMDISLEELAPVFSVSSAEEEWNAQELGKKINEFLYTLNRTKRVLFIKRYWFAYSVQDIAKDMGISENLVSVRLKRIRKQLRSYLEKEGYGV